MVHSDLADLFSHLRAKRMKGAVQIAALGLIEDLDETPTYSMAQWRDFLSVRGFVRAHLVTL